MQKNFKTFILILVLSSVITPSLLVAANPVPSQDEEIHFRMSVATTALDWDPASFNPSTADTYRYACLENMVTMRAGWDGYDLNMLIPVLATSWDVEPWPSEMNQAPIPFVNSGGVKAINWTLRENVTFHDGSIWNATVAKWNYDRIFIITGNLTGRGDTQMRDDYWINVNELEPFFTDSWNHSWGIGRVGEYNGMVAPGPANSSNPLWECIPLVNNTQVIDPGDPITGGGILRVEFNDWSTFWVYDLSHVNPGAYNLIISMETYKDDYTDQSFHGYDPIGGVHPLIGTGPYKFVHHTPTGPSSGGQLVKNENYWNRTALEADGWFGVDVVDFVVFPDDGRDERNAAFYTGSLDYAVDIAGWELDYDTVTTDPDFTYAGSDVGYQYLRCITMNCINETYWKDAWDNGIWYWNGTDWIMIEPPHTVPTDYLGNGGVGGIPRLLRKAISFAFDYDGFIQTAYEGRAFRANCFIGANSTYANEAIPMPYLNLTIAREAMLAQFPTECAANGLNSGNIDDDALWQSVGDGSTPIFKLNFYWDLIPDHLVMKNYLVTALRNIGCSYYQNHPNDNLPSNQFLNTWQAYAGGTFPYFIYNAFIGVDWTHYDNYIAHPFLYAYHRNIGDWSFDMGWNAAHMYLDNVTFWMEEFYYSNATHQQEIMDNVAITLQTYEYPWVWICETMFGAAWRVEWDIDIEFWDSIWPYTRVRYVGKEEEPVPIPGYSTGIIMSLLLVSMIGTIYAIARKKKLT
ncbi:MAG: ABC transporter substrate-binding protein [Candidatus Hermodarchaeota archaeon]